MAGDRVMVTLDRMIDQAARAPTFAKGPVGIRCSIASRQFERELRTLRRRLNRARRDEPYRDAGRATAMYIAASRTLGSSEFRKIAELRQRMNESIGRALDALGFSRGA